MSELVRRWGNDGWAIDDPKDGTETSVGVYPAESLGMTAVIQCPAGSEEDDGDVYGRILNHLCCELAALREENERLWGCVKAADAMREKMRKVYQRPAFMGVFDVYRVHGFTYPNDDADNWIREQDGYDAARAALGEEKP